MWTRAGFYYFLTLTAPSEVGQHCKRAGCDGSTCDHEKCRCTPPGGVDLAEWNTTAAKRWNGFLTLLERRYACRPSYFRAVEVQDGKRRQDNEGRGALHVHAIIWSPRKYSTRTVRQLAIAAGFGHSVDLEAIPTGSKQAAYYASKYVSKSCDARDDVPWSVEVVDPESGEISREQVPATFRTWSQSAKWGTTLRALRERALIQYLEDLADLSETSRATPAVQSRPPP